jgi:hypothetical protein
MGLVIPAPFCFFSAPEYALWQSYSDRDYRAVDGV